jgi:hypothetical protein
MQGTSGFNPIGLVAAAFVSSQALADPKASQALTQSLMRGASGFNSQGLAAAAFGGIQALTDPKTRQALSQQIVQNYKSGFCPPGIGEPFEFPSANPPVAPQTQPVAGQPPNPDYIFLQKIHWFRGRVLPKRSAISKNYKLNLPVHKVHQ